MSFLVEVKNLFNDIKLIYSLLDYYCFKKYCFNSDTDQQYALYKQSTIYKIIDSVNDEIIHLFQVQNFGKNKVIYSCWKNDNNDKSIDIQDVFVDHVYYGNEIIYVSR